MNSIPRRLERVDFAQRRTRMVDRQIAHRGVRSKLVLTAMKAVPRESFLPEELWELAYEDTPLPIAEGQTISQPYIVAMMTEALELHGGENVLEIGTGSGYAAAILSKIARDVYTVERIGAARRKIRGDARRARFQQCPCTARRWHTRLARARSLRCDRRRGRWTASAAISEGATQDRRSVGDSGGSRPATAGIGACDSRVRPRIQDGGTRRCALRAVGRRGRMVSKDRIAPKSSTVRWRSATQNPEKFASIDSVNLGPMLKRIGDARVVLLGEATHGTSEFYRMRERISRALIQHHGFSFIAIEGDWPDAARIDHYVRHSEYAPSEWTAFARFPVWMWRNREVREFVDWLRFHNADVEPAGWPFMVSISTACTTRFNRSSNTSIASTRRPRQWRANATDA